MAGEVIPTRFWRRIWLVVAIRNLFDLVLLAGCRNWLRNFSASFAALGSISLLAMLLGVFKPWGRIRRSAARSGEPRT